MRTALRPPQQERSKQTLERILQSTERLLEEREFDRLSMQEIVKASRTSVGAYYTRFRDKRALLAALYDRYDAGLDAWIAEWRAAQGDPPADLVGAIALVARYLITTFRARRHLLRALALYVRNHPEEPSALAKDRRVSQHRFLIDALLEHRSQYLHPDPEQATGAAVFAAASICRERILFSEGTHAGATQQTDEQLRVDVTRMLAGFLIPNPALNLSSI